jgi:transposase
MILDANQLPEDPSQLKNIIRNYQEKIHYLEEQVRLLQNEIFGRKSEKRPLPEQNQFLLFNEAEKALSENEEKRDPDTNLIVVPEHKRSKSGRKPLPADLPRVDIIHDIDESEKVCPCGSQLKAIGEEVSEKLDYVPAKVQVERHVRIKYACPACEGTEDEGPTVKIAPPPAQLLPKSMATAGLIAHIVTAKFEDALPLYRQEKIFARIGIDLPRATMAGWMIKTAERVSPITELLRQEIRGGPVANIDETPVQVLNEPGRANTTISYMWVFRGGDPARPALVYQYHPNRSGQVPLTFLSDYKGYVQTDGYNGYEALGRKPGVVLVGCWAHARRKFDQVIKAMGNQKKQSSADIALEYIGKLYAIEKLARQKELDAEEVRQLRQQQAGPILNEFKIWLDETAVKTPPKGLLGKAVGYTLSFWTRLIRYIDDGLLRPDNNLAENAIRPFVIGRKNWLFSAHPNGAMASAALYSLIETAKANGLKPYYYLRYLFDRLPFAQTEEDYRKLLPQSIDPADLGRADS